MFMMRVTISVVVRLVASCVCVCAPSATTATQLFPAIFTFGDSLLDAGNNNYLLTAMAKANMPPNGIDFPTHAATGRFCNGKTLVDLIAERVGLDYAPPYLAPTTQGEQLLQGVNYASGAAGILDETGASFIERLSFGTQIAYFGDTVVQVGDLLGASEMMYYLGVRKFALNSVGPIGCMPARIFNSGSPNGSCVAAEIEVAAGFNAAVQEMIPQLTSALPGAMILYANTYDLGLELLQNADREGFEVSFPGRCAFVGGQIPCSLLNVIINNSLCTDRSKYIFWDAYHPTEVVNVILSQKLFSGSTSYITPMNLHELSQWTSS